MLCPFLASAQDPTRGTCVERHCALWLAGEGVCSIRGIAEKLAYMEAIVNQVDEAKAE